jgi:hypothetical protein
MVAAQLHIENPIGSAPKAAVQTLAAKSSETTRVSSVTVARLEDGRAPERGGRG